MDDFKRATVGERIASGGQAAVYHLNTKNGNKKYVIKFSEDSFKKTIDFSNNFPDICERHKKERGEDIRNSFLKVERVFDLPIRTKTGTYTLHGVIEKYHPCLSKYKGPETNQKRDDIEIATRLGADLLPLLIAMEGKQVHRDIKPGNIFFKTNKLSDGFCLGDFGIVTNYSDGTLRTKILDLGTASTASPDIFLRDKYHSIFGGSTKGDMYSLAATMYYYLNDRTYPFTDNHDSLDLQYWEEIRKAGCRLPLHGSQKLKEIVCKALKFNPDDRFASCAEMLSELKKTEEYKNFITNPMGQGRTIVKKPVVPVETDIRKRFELQLEPENSTQNNSAPARKKFEVHIDEDFNNLWGSSEPQPQYNGEIYFSSRKPAAPLQVSSNSAQTRKKKKNKEVAKTVLITAAVAIVIICALFLISKLPEKIKENNYGKAVSYAESGDIANAAIHYGKAKDYKDAKEKSFLLWDEIAFRETVSAGGYRTVGVKSDGSVVAIGNDEYNQYDVSGWTDIVAVSAGMYHIVGLKSDGTVVAIGDNEYGQCDISDWTDIVSVSAGNYHTVGLKSNGSVVAVGRNNNRQCFVGHWKDITAVSAGGFYTTGIKSDGTVITVGKNYYGKYDMDNWSDITAVSVGSAHTVALKSDGTVVASGYNGWGECDVNDWTDIVAVSAGNYHTVGLKSDGTALWVGYDNLYLERWTVDDWSDVVSVSTGSYHTVGLKSDGTVVAVGLNEYGECGVDNWKNMMLPNQKSMTVQPKNQK
ncbi:MAG: hypothetical protein IKK63_06065 [Clostridia bacterium]|nr:hypothetical protein [Clostridia bacterium]